MKKILFSLLVITISTSIYAHDIEVKNADGVTIYYNYINNGTELAVTFQGDKYNSYSNEYEGNIVIPEEVTFMNRTRKVTSIGNYAFSVCSGLASISIPSCVTSIGNYAFSVCSGLASISIPSSVTSIGNSAFSGCSSLAFISIPSSVTSIGTSAFDGCSSLASISIPSSVTSIDNYTFRGCSGLASISIPSSVTSIGNSAFSGCSSLASMSIPSSVTSIGYSAFSGCSALTSITVDSGNSTYDSRNNCNAIIRTTSNTLVVGCKNTVIPSSVTSIGDYAFQSCSSLASISIPSSVTSINEYAFSGCSALAYISIPNSVTSIGNYAFQSCSGLASISIPSSVTSIGNYAFQSCSGLASISIPSSVTSIGNYAFSGCSSLASMSIPSSVTSIGYSAFSGCSGLTSITVDSGNSTYDSRNNCNAIIRTTSNTLVVGCKNTVIPSSVTSIGDYAFRDCSSLAFISIPSSVTSINEYAFSGCSALAYISIPNSVTRIGDFAFSGCSALTSIAIPENMTSIGSKAFSNCSSLNTIVINSNTIASKSYTDGESFVSIFGNQVQEYVLGNGITSIGNSAFRDCLGITSIIIPASVTRIGKNSFKGCKLHNILVMGVMPPEIDASSFTSMIHQHTILYVPAGCWDAYAFDNNWYIFNIIREVTIKENQISKQQTYLLMNTNNFSYSVYDPVNNDVGIINTFNNVNEDNPNHCWQLLEAAGNRYIYNVGAKKFLVKANNKIGLALSNMPEAINFQDGDDGIILGGDSSKRWALVRNESTFANQQIITGIDLVNGSTTTDNGSVYNLSGQRIVSLQKGVNIINGRKVLVK